MPPYLRYGRGSEADRDDGSAVSLISVALEEPYRQGGSPVRARAARFWWVTVGSWRQMRDTCST